MSQSIHLAAGEPAVVARGVVRTFGSLTALAGIDLALERGRITTLLGPNGAGKTTFVELVLGLARPDGGDLRTLGVRPGSPHARLGTGVMLQTAGFPPQLTVRELLELQSGYYPEPMPLATLLEDADLGEVAARRYGTLSGGQQRRVQFAAAIVGRPRLLVLDEPTVALDTESRRRCWALIRACTAAGAAVLLTTHQLEEADALADRVVLLARGRVIADGTPAAIRARVSEQTVRCRSTLAAAAAAALPGVIAARCDADRLEIRTTDAAACLRALLAQDPRLTEIEVARASLEDALAHIQRLEADSAAEAA